MVKDDNIGYSSKKALPNKLIQEDGTITDITGKEVSMTVEAYENKPALPNKFLNPDGSYSTLNQIIAEMVDTELFIIVNELPTTGENNKIYLLVVDDKLIEYIWVNDKWDPIGMIEFDLSNYYTKAEITQLLETLLQTAKKYADDKASAAEKNAKDYTDQQLENIDLSEVEQTCKDYADNVGASAVSNANQYTDTAIQQSITQALERSY